MRIGGVARKSLPAVQVLPAGQAETTLTNTEGTKFAIPGRTIWPNQVLIRGIVIGDAILRPIPGQRLAESQRQIRQMTRD
jgi:hypothetical protein